MKLQQVGKSYIKVIKCLLIEVVYFFTQTLNLTQVTVLLIRDHNSSNTQEQEAEIMISNPLRF